VYFKLTIQLKVVIIFTANERVVIDFRVKGERPIFVPDGMTIDSEGNLYVATFGGSSVLKIDPR
jgi:gluconolactonase